MVLNSEGEDRQRPAAQGAQPAVLLSADALSLPGRIAPLALELVAGEMLGLIGPNGAGKSSLLHALAGLLQTRGRLQLEGHELRTMHPRLRARKLALLPQQNSCSWLLRVHDVVSLGRLPWGDSGEEAIHEAMRLTGIEHLIHRPLLKLSSGEQARVSMARVLAGQPRVLLADEPAATLDLVQQRRSVGTLRAYADRGNAVVMAAHDLALAAWSCDRLLLLDQGRMLALGPADQVLSEERLARVYGMEIAVDLGSIPPRVEVRGPVDGR